MGIVLDDELSDDKDIQRQLRYQYCAANKLRASFSRCWNAVNHVLFRSFCSSTYASRLWRDIRKAEIACDLYFGCNVLYNLPWRASGGSHQVQCKIPTFEALLKKMCICFLNDEESLTTYGCALWCIQIVYIPSFFWTLRPHLLCYWVLGRYSVCLRACACHNTFVLYLALDQRCFLVVDRNFFEMIEENQVISVRMSENIG